MPKKNTAPNELGYSMPAEWHEHKATWLAWPHNQFTWHERIEKLEENFIEIIKALHTGEKINLLVNDKKTLEKVQKKLSQEEIDTSKIFIYTIKTGDAWIRDYGPNFLINRKQKTVAINDWNFNAWGNKYEHSEKDDDIPKKINKLFNMKLFSPGIILEGGSIDVNGNGSLLTTKQCLLNTNRNPHLSQEEIANYLKNYLGVSNIIWLNRGIEGDDTDGHVDDIARFINENTILCAYEENPSDTNFAILDENYNLLKSANSEQGKKFNIIKLPMPEPIFADGMRLPASYANFYIGNKSVLVPIFNQKSDKKALGILQGLFSDRKIVGINCTDMVYGHGAIHCLTQQEPNIL